MGFLVGIGAIASIFGLFGGVGYGFYAWFRISESVSKATQNAIGATIAIVLALIVIGVIADFGERLRAEFFSGGDRGEKSPIVTHDFAVRWTKFDGTTETAAVSGCESEAEARREAFRIARKNGWTPPRWWQWWRWGDTQISTEQVCEAA